MTNARSSSERPPRSAWVWVKRSLAVLGLALPGLLALIVLAGIIPLPLRGLDSQPDLAGFTMSQM